MYCQETPSQQLMSPFVRSFLDYVDVIYGQQNSECFSDKVKSV